MSEDAVRVWDSSDKRGEMSTGRQQLEGVLHAGHIGGELSDDLPLFIFGKQVDADGQYLQVAEGQAVAGIEELPTDVLHVHKLVGSDPGGLVPVPVPGSSLFIGQL